ncbi:hypothetical protein HYH03_001709 [Edaphochlamys debaryana]|uniref:Protein kinase domain-containing protein n=1 Tax=Edaphochlamys debaryana TaxID=47281 RepID=A0A836C5W5_9CHLO|nr:hypothetical protein HYH03_001709 [Edaphochlamys debaryana]|eukprot:KAG2500127.1 hypothetical protein HYH03_001709 [Edaphochlamys debaryana]
MPPRAGSSLRLSNLTLLLPPLPEAAQAAPRSLLAHLVAAAGGEGGGSLVLRGVTLVAASCQDLSAFATRLCDVSTWGHTTTLTVEGGVVHYKAGGSMALGLTSANATPAAAELEDVRVTCVPVKGGGSSVAEALLSGSAPGPLSPWPCLALAVANWTELLAVLTPEALAASSLAVLVTLTGDVDTVGSWQAPTVPVGLTVGLWGVPESGDQDLRVTRMHFFYKEILRVPVGSRLLLHDVTLTGLPYPATVTDLAHLLAAWVWAFPLVESESAPTNGSSAGLALPAFECTRCDIVLPSAEVLWWGMDFLGALNTSSGFRIDASLPSDQTASDWLPDTFEGFPGTFLYVHNLYDSLYNDSYGRALHNCTLIPGDAYSSGGPRGWPNEDDTSGEAARLWPLMVAAGTLEGALQATRRSTMLDPRSPRVLDTIAGQCYNGAFFFVPSGTTPDPALGSPRGERLAARGLPDATRYMAWDLSGPKDGGCAVGGPLLGSKAARVHWDMGGLDYRLILNPRGGTLTLRSLVLAGLPPSALVDAISNATDSSAGGGPRALGGGHRRSLGGRRRMRAEEGTTGTPPAPLGPPLSGLMQPTPLGSLRPLPAPGLSSAAAPLPAPWQPPSWMAPLMGLAAPLWYFDFDRLQPGAPRLYLHNVTLLVPRAELELMKRMLAATGMLPDGGPLKRAPWDPVPSSAPPGNEDDVWLLMGRGRRRLSQYDEGALSEVYAAASEQRCAFSLLQSFLQHSELSWYTNDTIFFATALHLGWVGQEVAMTAALPYDAPEGFATEAPPTEPDPQRLSPDLEVPCPWPPPQAYPSPPRPDLLPSPKPTQPEGLLAGAAPDGSSPLPPLVPSPPVARGGNDRPATAGAADVSSTVPPGTDPTAAEAADAPQAPDGSELQASPPEASISASAPHAAWPPAKPPRPAAWKVGVAAAGSVVGAAALTAALLLAWAAWRRRRVQLSSKAAAKTAPADRGVDSSNDVTHTRAAPAAGEAAGKGAAGGSSSCSGRADAACRVPIPSLAGSETGTMGTTPADTDPGAPVTRHVSGSGSGSVAVPSALDAMAATPAAAALLNMATGQQAPCRLLRPHSQPLLATGDIEAGLQPYWPRSGEQGSAAGAELSGSSPAQPLAAAAAAPSASGAAVATGALAGAEHGNVVMQQLQDEATWGTGSTAIGGGPPLRIIKLLPGAIRRRIGGTATLESAIQSLRAQLDNAPESNGGSAGPSSGGGYGGHRSAPGGAREEVALTGLLGRGANGVVYSGTWRGLAVAVKVVVMADEDEGVDEQMCTEPSEGDNTNKGAAAAAALQQDVRACRVQRRAVLEAAISSTLDHPNLVRAYAYEIRSLRPQPSACSGSAGNSGPGSGAGGSGGSAAVTASAGKGAADSGQCSPIDSGAQQLLIVMELCEKGSLKDALATGSLRSITAAAAAAASAPEASAAAAVASAAATALALALDVACGLAHLHAQGIVHGDLSPGNILLTSREAGGQGPAPAPTAPLYGIDAVEGSGEAGSLANAAAQSAASAGGWASPMAAKLCDFGLAVRLRPGASHTSGALGGTAAYAAPELAASGRLGRASDVFSLGVVMAELAAGPAAAAALRDAACAPSSLAPAPPPPVPPLLAGSSGEALWRLAGRCTGAEPRERPAVWQVVAELVSAGRMAHTVLNALTASRTQTADVSQSSSTC